MFTAGIHSGEGGLQAEGHNLNEKGLSYITTAGDGAFAPQNQMFLTNPPSMSQNPKAHYFFHKYLFPFTTLIVGAIRIG